MEEDFSKLASEVSINKACKSLEANGFKTFVYGSAEEAKAKLFELIPEKSEVMNMTSMTLDTMGVSDIIMNSGRYDSVRKKLMSMNDKTQSDEMRKLGSVPDYTIGSVHAVTENGEVLVASASGSQIPAYVYGAGSVIWVVGTQKIVRDLESARKRVYEYCLPLESERARKAYGIAGSSINKLLTVVHDMPDRTTIIFVKQKLGF